jgi:hypothetical protein
MHPDDLPRYISVDELKWILSQLPNDQYELLKDFIFHSRHPTAVDLRCRLRLDRALKWDAALKRQAKRSALAREYHVPGKGDIKPLASLDPHFAQDFRLQHGDDVWTNPEKADDTKKQAPKLFLE